MISQTITSYDEQKITNPSAVWEKPDPEDVQRIQQAAKLREAIKKEQNFCSCVLFVKGLTGFSKILGTAKNWPINAFAPTVGGVVVLNESPSGHVAYITAVTPTSFSVIEANFVSCKKTTRVIQLNDPDIKGFWKGGG